MTRLAFIRSPARLPPPPGVGRIALIDLAFAFGTDYDHVTLPFIQSLGNDLAVWIDHHDHPAWVDYRNDDRFVLVDKQTAPACPELVTPELARRVGPVDHVWAHADFDGCVAAAKFLRGGEPPYAEADEDARSIDAPGHGYKCSARGERLNMAMDQTHSEAPERYTDFIHDVAMALTSGHEPESLTQRIDELAARQKQRFEELRPLLLQAKRPHPDVAVLKLDRSIASSDKKTLLRFLEEEAKVAVIEEPRHTIFATYRDDLIDLSLLPGVKGGRGYVWGEVRSEAVLPALAALLADS